MKIYFSGSIRGGRDHKEFYSKIIALLKNYGEVLTEHIGDHKLTAMGEIGVTDEYVYERDMNWLKESDVVVADVTTPSVGVGYEIAFAEMLKKKVLCLYKQGSEKRISGMINGNKNIMVKTYEAVEDLSKILKDFFK
ncbi:MAG: nucleoside 2-deoxyribosyltransferase [Candidatus Nomurabacteria bacterium]|nr:nucleoside 2-deoxyribosyltransferase [Candidatus Nomurabacteria bacterium]